MDPQQNQTTKVDNPPDKIETNPPGVAAPFLGQEPEQAPETPQGIPPMESQPSVQMTQPEQTPPSLPTESPVSPPPSDSSAPLPLVGLLERIGIKKIGVITGGVLLILTFFLLILPRFAKPKEVTLTYWGLWEPESVFGGVIADFQKANPGIKINYIMNSPKEYRERLSSALARNQGPDIFRFHNTWVPMLKSELAPIPVKTIDQATFEARYYPVARQDLKVGGFYVGIPLEIDGLGLFVNDDLFRAAGKNPPKTWNEMETTARELTVRDDQGNIQVAGVALGRTENIDHWSDILGIMMLQNEADLANPALCSKKSVEVETCYGADALTFFTLFSTTSNVWDKTLPSSTQAFASGKLAMYFGPSWEIFTIKEINPRLNFRVLPIPQIENTNITWASYWVEGISKKSAQQEAAWKFLKYLSEKETMQKLYQAESSIRLFGEPYARSDMADLIKDNDFVGAFVKQAPDARSWYLSSRTFDNGLNDMIIKYYEDAINAVNSGQGAKEALNTAASGISQVLTRYSISAPVVR